MEKQDQVVLDILRGLQTLCMITEEAAIEVFRLWDSEERYADRDLRVSMDEIRNALDDQVGRLEDLVRVLEDRLRSHGVDLDGLEE